MKIVWNHPEPYLATREEPLEATVYRRDWRRPWVVYVTVVQDRCKGHPATTEWDHRYPRSGFNEKKYVWYHVDGDIHCSEELYKVLNRSRKRICHKQERAAEAVNRREERASAERARQSKALQESKLWRRTERVPQARLVQR